MTYIEKIEGREILDSRGNPTVEACVYLNNGIYATASVPSGASTGSYEALELRDKNKKRFDGKGVLKAVKNINEIISPALHKIDGSNQQRIDKMLIQLDGNENKSHLGANAMLAVSLAICKSYAKSYNIPLYQYIGGINAHRLPLPMFNILNGGAHADNLLDIQEFMIIPRMDSFTSNVQIGAEIFNSLKNILKEKGHVISVGDEGGFAPKVNDIYTALDLILNAIEKAGYKPDEDVSIGLDIASSEFYNKKEKVYEFNGEKIKRDSANMLSFYEGLINKYPIVSIEDPFFEDDFDITATLTKSIGNKVKIVGDDLFTTNYKRLKKGIEMDCANAIIIKLNQIGTLSETLKTIELAKKNSYTPIISHRSGETTDTFIADLAVALNCDLIKSGSLSRGERVCKYNRLMEIERNICR